MIQADGALGEHLTTIWIHFTSWDGFSRKNTQQIYFKLSSVIFLKNLDFYFLFLTFLIVQDSQIQILTLRLMDCSVRSI